MATNMIPQEMLPPPVQQAAAAGRLGAFMKAYKAGIVRTIIGALVFLIGGMLFLGGGLLAPDVPTTTRGILVVFALFFIGMAIYMIVSALQVANQQVYLFQQGLVVEKNNQVELFPWNQTAEVWQSVTRHYRNGVYTGTTYTYKLHRTDGYQVKLDNMTKNIAELGPVLVQGITRELVPRALNSIRAGQTLTFTPFSVNQQGIGRQSEFLPWQQVQEVEVKQGRVIVKMIGAPHKNWSAEVAKIPNCLVFTVVAEEMRRQAGGR